MRGASSGTSVGDLGTQARAPAVMHQRCAAILQEHGAINRNKKRQKGANNRNKCGKPGDNSNYSPKLPKNSSRGVKHQPLLWGSRNTWDKHGSRQVATQLRQFGQSFGRDFENRIVQLICVAAVCENTRKRTRTSPKPKTAVVDSTWSANTFGQQAQP